ncbi:hypothetical protein M0802_012383 [Mischocyttarus mexicanus]|nr:hypothetical protein M0802_012383 [Mischocyttarus mexicanus]
MATTKNFQNLHMVFHSTVSTSACGKIINHHEQLPPRSSVHAKKDVKPIRDEELVKALGIFWNPDRDEFGFTVRDPQKLSEARTKRLVLFSIARLCDPLRWLVPVTATARRIMQDS